MNQRILSYKTILLFLFPYIVWGQQKEIELSFEQSAGLLQNRNQTLQIASKEIEWAKSEQQRLNAFWYPTINASGAYLHLSNNIEVKEPLNQFTDPAKELVHSIIPDDQLISSILDQIGTHSLSFPLMPRNLTSIDATITWPIFTGGKRIFASQIGKKIVSIAEIDREQVNASLQTVLVESYFGLRLGQKVIQVRKEAYQSLCNHYENAQKLEVNGMINKAERLFAQVNMNEAKRELEASRKDIYVAQQALKSIINLDSAATVYPTTPLFINESLPSASYFKSLIGSNSYIVNKLQMQKHMAESQLKMDRSGYVPNIAFIGKQTMYAHGIEKNLIPRTMVGIAFTWNIFDGLDREKRIQQSRISSQSLVLGKSKAIRELEVGIDKFYSQIQNALDDVSTLNTTIEMSNELLRIRKQSFGEGMATSTEVIDAEVICSKVKIAYLLAYYQYDVALIHLLSACGIPYAFTQYRREGKTEQFMFPTE